MKRRNETTIEFIGNERQDKRPRPFTSLLHPGGSYYRLSWLKFYSDGTSHGVSLGLEEGLERACRIPLDQINERFAGVAGLNLDFNPIIIDNRGRSIKLTFTLQRKDGFCETAINKAFLILSRLGVGEEIALEVIQDLQLTQIQQVKFQGVWLSYYQYLMLTHPLMRNRKTS